MSWLYGPIPAAADDAGPVLVSIAVTPANKSLLRIDTQQYTAIGTYSDSSTADITATATWSTGSSAVATIAAGGLLTVAGYGSTSVNAQEPGGGIIVGTTNVFVSYLEVGGHQWVLAIEGYPYLLTDGDTVAAIAAWADTDWAQALGGLFVDLTVSQAIDPWEPFTGGGSLTFYVQPTGTDIFGIDTHKTAAGAETYLTSTINRTATNLNVKSTASFPSSGNINLGTEFITYTGKTDIVFTGCVRGKYAPFRAEGSVQRFAQQHRVGNTAVSPLLQPVVSEQPRSWRGRWVGLWKHTRSNNVALDTRANATLVFAGKLVDLRDDPETGCTVVSCDHLLDVIKDATLMRDRYTAKLRTGIFMKTGWSIDALDTDGGTQRDANALKVVASGATGTNEINEGWYELAELISLINEWLTAEIAANRLWALYGFSISPSIHRIYIGVNFQNVGEHLWGITFPQVLAVFLGLTDEVTSPGFVAGSWRYGQNQVGGVGPIDWVFPEAPYVSMLVAQDPLDGVTGSIGVVEQVGSWIDQTDSLPSSVTTWVIGNGGGTNWGLFQAEDILFVAKYNGVDQFDYVWPVPPAQIEGLLGARLGEERDIEIKQIVRQEGLFKDIIKRTFYSTGTASYNESTNGWDSLAHGIGIAIPWELLVTGVYGASTPVFDNSVDALDGADNIILVESSKTETVAAILSSDMILRRAHLVWKDESLQFVSWSTPVEALSVASLAEADKAEPVGNEISQRSATALDGKWAHPIVKVEYNRDIDTDDYHDTFQIEDRVATDDAGGVAKPYTIEARNVVKQSVGSGPGIEELFPKFLAWHPFFSRPIRFLRRSIGLTHFTAIAPGDIITVADNFARDPVTGQRGATRYGLITRHEWSPGGPIPTTGGSESNVQPMGGEIEIAMLELDRIPVYAPCAQVDDTATTGGFDAGYSSGATSLRTYEHEHSLATEAVDASRFAAGDKITIIEIDPSDPAAPTIWSRTVSSVSGNDIVLTAALSSPAWDNTKRYRIISQVYSAAATGQKVKAYSADDADARIEDLAPPFLYGSADVTAFTAEASSVLPVRRADFYNADGAPRDTGCERDAFRMLNNLWDHRTARHMPLFDTASRTVSASSTNWVLLYLVPVFFSQAIYTIAVGLGRLVYVAPFVRSSDGTSTACRVTLAKFPTSSNTLTNVVIPAPSVSVTFSSITSTSFVTPSEQTLNLNVLQPIGLGWLHVEGRNKLVTRGIAKLIERARV